MQRVKQFQNVLYCVTLVLSLFFLGSCTLPAVPQASNGQSIESFGFNAISVHPVFKSYLRVRPGHDDLKTRMLTIYIEGDGASWFFRSIPPSNPTPYRSLVVAMAASDQSEYVLYLARPCQFIDLKTVRECDESLWTDGRFSTQVITLFNQAIDEILRSTPALKINLIGHSGGGTLATLIAAQRSDVNCLVTLASPLDLSAWTQALAIASLLKSKNPADPNANLKQIRQTHFFGERDAVVSMESIGRYQNFPPHTDFIMISGFDHQKFWVEHWPTLQRQSCLTH